MKSFINVNAFIPPNNPMRRHCYIPTLQKSKLGGREQVNARKGRNTDSNVFILPSSLFQYINWSGYASIYRMDLFSERNKDPWRKHNFKLSTAPMR